MRLFVVDDDLVIGGFVSDILSSEGFEVQQFSDPVEALTRIVSGDKPDFIVSDLQMPGMSGRELLRRAGIPGLIMTGSEEDVEDCVVLRKPSMIN